MATFTDTCSCCPSTYTMSGVREQDYVPGKEAVFDSYDGKLYCKSESCQKKLEEAKGAKQKQKAAAVHGNVLQRTRSAARTREVPAQEGRQGVRRGRSKTR